MILNIHLKNFTIIETLDLEFHDGMTALTGETGAGKSIIIDAIALALGARLDTKVVREGAEKADIHLSFSLQRNAAARNWLQQHDLEAGDECIIRRTISQDGRSRAFINNSPVTLQTLSDLGSFLVDIHGQHEHQNLLKKDKQLELLDAYGRHEELLEKNRRVAKRWRDCKNRYQALQTLCRNEDNRREFLLYQLQELQHLNLQPGEVEQLEQEHKQLSHAESLLNHCQQALTCLSEEEHAVDSRLNQALQHLEAISYIDSQIHNAVQLLNSALIQIQEADHEIRRYLHQIELNPEKLQEVEDRLSAIHDLARKHRLPAQNLIVLQEQFATELAALDNSDREFEQLQKELTRLEHDYHALAGQLSHARREAANQLQLLVTRDMHELGMQGGQFSIAFQPLPDAVPNPQGSERVEFLVSANPGQTLQPMAKVASGGELSRISLAIQVNTAKVLKTPSLIFDEVDSGISGGIAEIVGRLLRRLGDSAQVFCITHLPQVAALAHHHYQVRKIKNAASTETRVHYLSPEEKVEEIARMLGGVKITRQTREHAKEMLANS